MSSTIALAAPSRTGYRADIDGLRALAVIPVVLFHAGIPGLAGGFVGVDVFFVISGYLITGILYRELTGQTFSLLKFYERRIRRIMPNLLAVLLSAIAGFTIIYIPTDLIAFGQSVIATMTFSANIYFYLKIGYFAAASQQIALLHMWSLGIEEQYYVLFPFVLRAAFGLPRAVFFGLMWTLFAASLALSAWYVKPMPDMVFYLPMFRLWELMTGSLLAIGAVPVVRNRALREVIAVCGLAAVIAAIVRYDAYTPFPGPAALLPCLGAGALIHTNARGLTLAGRVLSWRPFVAIGLVSYSLYIWHWPIIVFTRYLLQRPLQPAEILVMLAAIAGMSVAAWRWVEVPMRARTVPVRRLLIACGLGSLLVIALAGALIVLRGVPGRYDAATRKLALATYDINPARAQCDHPDTARLTSGDVCHVGPSGPPRFAMIGDSFGDALQPALARAAETARVPGVVMTFSGCAPLPDVDEPAGHCRSGVAAAYALVAHQPSIRSVIVIGRWPTMVSGHRDGLFQQDRIWMQDALSRTIGPAENARVIAAGLVRATRLIAPARLVVVTGIPEQHVDVPQAATLAQLFGWPRPGLSRAAFDARQAAATRAIDAAGRVLGMPLHILDLSAAMCSPDICPVVAGGAALYVDDNHPSRTSAQALAPNFARELQGSQQ